MIKKTKTDSKDVHHPKMMKEHSSMMNDLSKKQMNGKMNAQSMMTMTYPDPMQTSDDESDCGYD